MPGRRTSQSPTGRSRSSSVSSTCSNYSTDAGRERWGLPRRRSRRHSISRQEIDDILNGSYTTNYTYADSASYKHDGQEDYQVPRLSRPRIDFGLYGSPFNSNRYLLRSEPKQVYVWRSERSGKAYEAASYLCNLAWKSVKGAAQFVLFLLTAVYYAGRKALGIGATLAFPQITAPFIAWKKAVNATRRSYQAARLAKQEGYLSRLWNWTKSALFTVLASAILLGSWGKYELTRSKSSGRLSLSPTKKQIFATTKTPITPLGSPRQLRMSSGVRVSTPVTSRSLRSFTPRAAGDENLNVEPVQREPYTLKRLWNAANFVKECVFLVVYAVTGWALRPFRVVDGQLRRGRGRPAAPAPTLWQKFLAVLKKFISLMGALPEKLRSAGSVVKAKYQRRYSPNRSRSPVKTRRQLRQSTLADSNEAVKQPEQPYLKPWFYRILSSYFWVYYGGLLFDLLKKTFIGTANEPSLVRKGADRARALTQKARNSNVNWLPWLLLLLLLFVVGYYGYSNKAYKNRDVFTALSEDTHGIRKAVYGHLPPPPSIEGLKHAVGSVSSKATGLTGSIVHSVVDYGTESYDHIYKLSAQTYSNIKDTMFNGIDRSYGLATGAVGTVGNGINYVFTAIFDGHRNAYHLLKGYASAGLESVSGATKNLAGSTKDLAGSAASFSSESGEYVKTSYETAAKKTTTFLAATPSALASLVSSPIKGAQTLASNAIHFITEGSYVVYVNVRNFILAVFDLVVYVLLAIRNFIVNSLFRCVNLLLRIFDSISSFVRGIIDSLRNGNAFVGNLTARGFSGLETIAQNLTSAGQIATGSVYGAIKYSAELGTKLVYGAGNRIYLAGTGVSGALNDAALYIVYGLNNGRLSVYNVVTGYTSQGANAISAAGKEVVKSVGGIGSGSVSLVNRIYKTISLWLFAPKEEKTAATPNEAVEETASYDFGSYPLNFCYALNKWAHAAIHYIAEYFRYTGSVIRQFFVSLWNGLKDFANYVLLILSYPFVATRSYASGPIQRELVVEKAAPPPSTCGEVDSTRAYAEIEKNLDKRYNDLVSKMVKDHLAQHELGATDFHISQIVKNHLARYDADKTGLPDFAMESAGGSIVGIGCTKQYQETSRLQSVFGVPLWYANYGPRGVIQRKTITPGECWAFVGHGHLKIKLSQRVNVTAVSYEHLPRILSFENNSRTAPKEIKIWSYHDEGSESKHLLGAYVYDDQSDSLQTFKTQYYDTKPTEVVELEVESNHGAEVTCLYRFRVHGQPAPGPAPRWLVDKP